MTAATPDSATSSARSPTAADSERRLARLTVHPEAVADNWRFFAKLGSAEAAGVVKADGYGLGAVLMSRALANAGCRTFFVATPGEGLEVRRTLGAAARILVLNGAAASDIAALRDADLEPVLNTLAQIALWRGAGDKAFTLHVDTGMSRLGLPLHEIGAAAHSGPSLVMSHLACASDPRSVMNQVQRARFLEAASLFPHARKSLSASAGALLGPDYAFDLLRPGVGLYGGGALDAGNPPLATAATLTAPLLQVRDLAAGETVGYGATFTASAPMRIGTAGLGYADGFLRSLSGKGYGVAGGRRCPILGRVSMDLVTVDLSAAPAAAEGDVVEFLGPNVRLDDVAALAGTIPYEILTSLAGLAREAA